MSIDAKNHWVMLRLTAVMAIPLCIWFVYSIVTLAGADHAAFTAWLKQPMNAVLMILFIIINFYHAALGCHEIIEDYVHNEQLKKTSLCLKALAFLVTALICIAATVKVAFL